MEHTKRKEHRPLGDFFHNMTHNLTEFMGDTHIEKEGDAGREYPMLVKMADAVAESIEGCWVSVPGCTREAGENPHMEQQHKEDTLWGHRWNNEMTSVLLMSLMPLETPLEHPKYGDQKEQKSSEKGLIWRMFHPIKSLNELNETNNRGMSHVSPTHDANYIVPPV